MKRLFFVAATLAACFSGCGYVGDPLPPALNIPAPVSDLRAIQFGPNILVQFTLPSLTTDGLPLTDVQGVELVANETPYAIPSPMPGPIEYEFPASRYAGSEVVLRVHAIGRTGRVSDWSNAVRLNVGAPLMQPNSLKPESTRDGVALTWSGDAPRYRILRAIDDGDLAPIAEVDTASYLDMTTVYGARYRYMVLGIAGATQESLPSEIASIIPIDTFPPAVPTGLAAVPGASTIELSWNRNTEADFRSYRLRRSVDNGPAEVIATVDTPAYSDRAVESARRYVYTLSAVDDVGNESAPSESIEAALP